MSQEIWKKVKEDDRYEVSNLGRVRSNIMGKLKILKCSLMQTGYFRVTIGKPSNRVSRKVHILVLESFVGPRPLNFQACHKNDIRTDNRLENLRWDSALGNAQDRIKNGKSGKGSKNSFSKLTEDDVLYILNNYKRFSYRNSNKKELAKKFNISIANINEIIQRRRWTHV